MAYSRISPNLSHYGLKNLMPDSSGITVDRYAVYGNPIEHSKSPLIHTLFGEQTHQNINYKAVLVLPEHFNHAVNLFAKSGGKGLNITVPFKLDAWKIATQLNERAKRAGAVNTLLINDVNDYSADNTDGIGLVNDLTINHQIEIKNKTILMLGAGGAVRGTLQPLLEKEPEKLIIANRTKEKALQLENDFSDLGNIIGVGLDEIQNFSADIIINGTSASLKGELPSIPASILHEKSFCYAMMYASEATVFMQWAIENGATNVSDGLGMLVEQAAESFYLWRQVRPETKSVIQTVRNTLSK